MSETQFKLANLYTLLHAVRLQPESGFFLNRFRKDTECGTLFCTVGLATTMPRFQAMGLSLVKLGEERDAFYKCELNGQDAYDNPELNDIFGERAFNRLFNSTEVGGFDAALGYSEEYNGMSYEGNMTHKELAIKRLEKQIAILEGRDTAAGEVLEEDSEDY